MAAVALTGGYTILRLQVHYVGKEDDGLTLSRWTQLLADGSGIRTSVGPWLAAVLFGLTARRVLTRAPEPPLGVAGEPTATVGEMRRGLRRELHQMRWLLLVVAALAAIDLGRLTVDLAYTVVRHNSVARVQLGWTAIEASGLVVAAAALAVAVVGFRRQVRDLGAI